MRPIGRSGRHGSVTVVLWILASVVALACTGTASQGAATATAPGGGATPGSASKPAASTASQPVESAATSPIPTKASPGPTSAAQGEASASAPPTKAQITFDLDLEGAVDPSDAYKVELSVDGKGYVNGFCGYQGIDSICSRDILYSWSVPSIAIGAVLDWSFVREIGGQEFKFAGRSDVPFEHGLIVKARCLYNPQSATIPECIPVP